MEIEMNINSKIIRSLREERAWSQDHLAQVAGVSLRTIQRVEADGSASAETKMALATAFGVSLSELTPKGAAVEISVPIAVTPVRYKIALTFALTALVPVIINQLSTKFPPMELSTFCLFVAISLGLYGGFGGYFHGLVRKTSTGKSAAQVGFVSFAIFSFFTAFSAAPRELMLAGLQMAVLATGIYFGFAYFLSRKRS